MEKYECVVEDAIDSRAAVLTSLGQYLWQNPEVAFAERKAHDYISDYLEKEGFQVVRKYVLPTAFRAEFGDGDVTAAFLCEYDALPGLGHACGHNLIAQGSVAAAVAVKEVLRQASLAGKVVMLGTPAEEGGGGKVHLLRGGAFDGIDYALMAHPSSRNVAACRTTAVTKYAVTYKGLPAHSAGAPWQGRNALDAAVAAYVNVAMLRQQASFAKAVTSPTSYRPMLRWNSICALQKLRNSTSSSAGFAPASTPEVEAQGLQFPDGDVSPASSASTDVGNVSHAIPTIQPYYALEAATSGGNHTEGFREASNDQRSYDVTLKVAKALALTAISVMNIQAATLSTPATSTDDAERLLTEKLSHSIMEHREEIIEALKGIEHTVDETEEHAVPAILVALAAGVASAVVSGAVRDAVGAVVSKTVSNSGSNSSRYEAVDNVRRHSNKYSWNSVLIGFINSVFDSLEGLDDFFTVFHDGMGKFLGVHLAGAGLHADLATSLPAWLLLRPRLGVVVVLGREIAPPMTASTGSGSESSAEGPSLETSTTASSYLTA
ncbi:hypothetical protein HPB52_007817 [Rhipicephalus sanguineus]|uniref:Peptidase M20 domain-containing protein 2 n=1 Tax=Rhipicephalus sanguineus TaxID=34632 RepID=A0A9D4PIJ5_RHISA|nr:hypothetical protein HPB52_007817 [Rhipicephalus sanguineus]